MIKLAIVGVGKIAQEQHVPSIQQSDQFELLATASPEGQVAGVPAYLTIESMLDAHPDIQAIALCMPPQFRFAAACLALERGCHVLLEKPPGATVSEVQQLHARAHARGLSLYATWHSRHAAAVAFAKATLQDAAIRAAKLSWIEDVRKWHPQQEWIWQAGGLGVFDPGINGLSILSEVLPDELRIAAASFCIPANKHTPIAARLQIGTATGFTVEVELDWQLGAARATECWQIEFATEIGQIALIEGGAVCLVNGERAFPPLAAAAHPHSEYSAIYAEFAHLIQSAQSFVDLVPLQLVADSFLIAEVERGPAFEDAV